jgi:hypothetical protein
MSLMTVVMMAAIATADARRPITCRPRRQYDRLWVVPAGVALSYQVTKTNAPTSRRPSAGVTVACGPAPRL